MEDLEDDLHADERTSRRTAANLLREVHTTWSLRYASSSVSPCCVRVWGGAGVRGIKLYTVVCARVGFCMWMPVHRRA